MNNPLTVRLDLNTLQLNSSYPAAGYSDRQSYGLAMPFG